MKRFLFSVASDGLAGLAHVLQRVREAVEWARIGAAVVPPSPEPVRPDTEPARPPEHPHYSVVWPHGDPAKGGRFDDPKDGLQKTRECDGN
jgi:hypothetical protein